MICCVTGFGHHGKVGLSRPPGRFMNLCASLRFRSEKGEKACVQRTSGVAYICGDSEGMAGRPVGKVQENRAIPRSLPCSRLGGTTERSEVTLERPMVDTMHFNDNFALVALIVFAAIGLVSSAHADGLNLNDNADGNYTDSGTWTPAGDPDDGLADTVTIDSHTVTITGAGQASNDTVTVSAGGTLTTVAVSDVLKGATIVLNGGTLLKPWQLTVDLGGDIEVAADSVFSGSRYVSYNDSLDFTAASSLTITNAQSSDGWNAVFRAFTVTNNATLDLRYAAAVRSENSSR